MRRNLLIFYKLNFLAPGLKKLLLLQEELSKLENQTRNYSLELLTYHCIHYFVAVRLFINNVVHHRYLTEF